MLVVCVTAVNMLDTESPPEDRPKRPATHAERNAAELEKMTDDFEEAEVSAGMTDALKKVTGENKHSSAPVSKIKIKSEDIDLLVSFSFLNIFIGVVISC